MENKNVQEMSGEIIKNLQVMFEPVLSPTKAVNTTEFTKKLIKLTENVTENFDFQNRNNLSKFENSESANVEISDMKNVDFENAKILKVINKFNILSFHPNT